jgi:hypothetical protein
MSFSRTFAAPLDVCCALDEVVLAVVEAEFVTVEVELSTNEDREVLAVPAPDELEEILLQPCKQYLRTGLFPFPEGDDIPGDKMLSHLQQSLIHSCTCIEHPQLLARIPSKMRI